MRTTNYLIFIVLLLSLFVLPACGGSGSGDTGGTTIDSGDTGGTTIGSGETPGISPGETFFVLSSELTGEVPFTVGMGFKKGDVLDTPTLNIDSYQVEVKKRWNDNSVKHAIFSGTYSSVANSPTTIKVNFSGAKPTGDILTEADIVSAAPSASIQVGGIGTINLSDLLGAPVRIWLSGPEVVEAHYQRTIGSDNTLVAKFYVRLYRGGKIFIRAIVENGALNVASTRKDYLPSIVIGGTTVYNNSGLTISHYAHTRYDATGWIKTTDPKTTIAHDTTYLMNSGLVPNYAKSGPSESVLNSLVTSYIPMDNANLTVAMGDTGFQEQIGLLPLWDALYINSGGDSRAFNSVISNARALNSYGIVWPDSSTHSPIILSNWGKWTILGEAGGGETIVGAGGLTWDIAHHPSEGYLAYLITGDYYFLETMEYQSTLVYLVTSSNQGTGTSRLIRGQTRGVAWANRTIGQVVAIAPLDDVVKDLRSLLSNDADSWYAKIQTVGINKLGYLYSYEISDTGYGVGFVAPWQQHFWVQTYGYLSDLEPLSNMNKFNLVRDHLYKSVIGILGPNGTNNYCFTKASEYIIKISDYSDDDPTTWYNSWGIVYKATTGSENTSCGNTLGGTSGAGVDVAATGYWGNLLPAIAYAVDDQASGAEGAWTRLISADNWYQLENSGFENIPIWGILPR